MDEPVGEGVNTDRPISPGIFQQIWNLLRAYPKINL